MAHTNETAIHTIDEYIAQFPAEAQEKMQKLREVIRETAQDAQEKISWGMPTFVLYGNLVHFAAYKKHIGFYPGASGIEAFKGQFQGYQWSKGAVQFPLDKPVPYDLVRDIVRFRMAENILAAARKKQEKVK